MMRWVFVTCLAFVAAAFAGCGSSTTTVPPVVVAGEFIGPVTDSVAGKQSGDLVLAQHGVGLGGSMTLTAGSTSQVESVTLILNGSALSGSGVMDVNGAACTFTITGSFANQAITASYAGVSGCSNTGTWSLSQSCAGSPAAVDRRTPQLVIPTC